MVSAAAAASGAREEERWPLKPESFWAVVARRARYATGIVISMVLMGTVGWEFAAPPAQWAGVSLMVWREHGILASFVLAILLILAAGICSLLVHPDAPHMGLFCAMLGFTALAVRGGTVHMLIVYGQETGMLVRMLQVLAIECVQWAIILLIGEIFARMLHERFLKNTYWITRSAPILSMPPEDAEPGMAIGVAAQFSGAIGTGSLKRWLGIPLAMVISGVAAFALLYALMQSQAQGQVLMACFVGFFGSTVLAYLLVPRVPMLPLLLVVPLTASVGYLITAKLTADHAGALVPGHAALFIARALPITYMGAGVPGAILGYYAAFRWSLHSAEEG